MSAHFHIFNIISHTFAEASVPALSILEKGSVSARFPVILPGKASVPVRSPSTRKAVQARSLDLVKEKGSTPRRSSCLRNATKSQYARHNDCVEKLNSVQETNIWQS
ncbi:hypothetical protein AVEN_223808-1 [Araneus ventricosus]|uniref:Uncharacterized protein n=1 Tax=Araneus ventricosus TaxID=182803 RepID=A0A4Y2DM46_ARAVE|nr:hypothetical protein AVEN_223808-1 [Araneus ventricosus]